MKWNLRLAAAHRGIWKASDLRRLLAERGLEISAGKMSGLWSGQPSVLRPEELDAFCAVLGCDIAELITTEPETLPVPENHAERDARAVGAGEGTVRRITPKPKSGRSLPPR